MSDAGRAEEAGHAPVANGDAEHGAGERDTYKRRVAVVLALLGVLGAWIGVLHMDSANNEARYARETTRTAVRSMRANVNAETVAGLERDLDAERAGLGVIDTFENGATDAGQPDETNAEQADEATAGLDPQERDDLARRLSLDAHRLKLTRSALAETRVTYNNRTSQYETVLTTLAVALFLVGFTLVLNRRTRPPVLIPGLLLVIYVGGWALWIHQRDIPTTEPEAIDAAARGATHLEFDEFDQAATAYTEAIAIDDGFVAAYTGRSIASFLTANPDFTSTLAVVDTDGAEVRQAVEDAERAVELGNNRDFAGLFTSGLYRFYDGDYDGSVERLRQAAKVNDRAPEAQLALGAAHLAAGNTDAARTAMRRGVALLDPTEQSAEARQLAADLFTMLEQVAVAVPEQREAVVDIRTGLAGGEAALSFGDPAADERPGGALAEGTFTLENSDVGAGHLEVAIGYHELPSGSQVSLYAYTQPAEGAAFVQPTELARLVTLGGSGTLRGEAALQTACMPVALRYDLYVNGLPVASFDAPGVEATC